MDNPTPALASKKQDLLRSYLEFPSETATVDYKQAFAFKKGDAATHGLIKDILGMANAGGGYLVLGYMEEKGTKKLVPQKMLPTGFLDSYDPSALAVIIEDHIDGTDKIALQLHKIDHPNNGNTYPVIEVHGFTTRPFFCGKTLNGNDGKPIFERGDICIRIAAARTTIIAGPSEWEQLIELCVSKKQDELVKRFTGILQSASLLTADALPLSLSGISNSKGLKEKLREAASSFVQKNNQPFDGMELFHYPIHELRGIKQSFLRDVAAKAAQPNTGWPIGAVLVNNPLMTPKVVTDGVTAEMVSGNDFVDFWHFNKSGAFYVFRNFEEENIDGSRTRLYFDTRIWRVVEGLKHCVSLYENLGIQPDTVVTIEFSHFGLTDRVLESSHSQIRMYEKRQCSQDKSEWKKSISLDLLKATLEDVAYEICHELFLLFDFYELPRELFDRILEDYVNSRVR